MTLPDLVAARELLQNLLDTYQIRDPGMTDFKSALVMIDNVLALPDPAATVEQPVTATADVVAGVVAGLTTVMSGINAGVAALQSDNTTMQAWFTKLDNTTAQILTNTNTLPAQSAPAA